MSTIRVLHVDDEPSFGDLVSDFLEMEDERIEVTTETSASDALEYLDEPEEVIDCVVSDFDMPGKNGIEFLEAVRERDSDLPFILFTGKGSEEVASDAISAGATDYLQKSGGTDQYTVLANRIKNAYEAYRAEQELKEATELYETTLSNMSDTVLITDDEGEFTYICPNVHFVFGYSADEVAELESIDAVFGDVLVEQDELDGRGEISNIETTITTKDGDERTVLVTVKRVSIQDGTRLYTVRDITDLKERERELELRNRAINEAPVGITITDPHQADNPIIYANDKFIEVSGHSPDEIFGENHRFLQGPETRDEPVAAMRDAIDNQEPVTVELRNYRQDGEMFWNRVSIAPVHDEDGNVTNYIGFQEDITDRKEREQELRRNERRFEAMFNDPNILVGLLKTDGTVIDINETAMEYIETEVEDVREQLFWETPWWEHDPDIQDSVKEWVEQAANGEYVPFETDITRSDGGLATINGVFRPVQDKDDEIVSLIISDRDITDRKDRERRFEAMFEDPNILVGLLEPDGTVLNINDTAMEYVEADLEDITGTPFSTTPWWPEEMQSVIRETVKQAANGEYVEYEADLEKPDGTPYSVTGVIRPVTNDRDEVISLIVSARDITERVRRERTLDAILENTTTPLFMKNRDGEYILVNEGFRELFGLEDADVHGQTDADLFPPEMAEEVQKNDDHVLETGEPVETEEHIVTEDGEYVFLSSKVPVYDLGLESESDEPVAVFGVANDITDRKQREEELERIRDRMEFALERTDSVIWERDPDTGRITTYPEPCPLLENTVETEDEFIKTVHPDDREAVSDAVETVTETGEPTQVEYRTNDGLETEWLEAQIEPVTEDGDSVDQLVGLTRDITEQKRRKQVLERQNERFDELASAVSHDLQTPLSTARGRAELAIETGDTEQMEKSLTALERADQLREDLVNVLRTREIVGETESIDLGDVAEEVWKSITASDEASLQIEASVTIDGDLNAVRRLLENLFSNSIEHGREDVTVHLGRIDDGFYVEDDGSGIPEDERDDVFRPGYSTKEGGSGVGMVSVREIALAHEWTISIAESETGGARFEIHTDVTNDQGSR